MEFKGTQGPWKIIHGGFRNDDGFSIGSDNATASRVKVTAECWPCTIVDQEHRDELLANARLIAAAPELLAACQDLLNHASVTEHMSAHSVEQARAAIAKALWESS